MSLGGIIGGAIGFFVGGPTGAKWGYAIGSALDAPAGQDYTGPRLNDLRVQTSTYGAPIPIVYGSARLAGNIIWALPIREQEVVTESSSKGGGGGSQTTFEYYGTFAVALCDNEIAGIRRIWADSNLIFNNSDTATLETLFASFEETSDISVYYGTETQEADSLIQADKGAANTQAYRGTAYIVFNNIALEKYGNRIPSISAEVLTSGTVSMRLVENQDVPLDNPAEFNVAIPYFDNDNAVFYVFTGQWDSGYSSGLVKVSTRYVNGTTVDRGTYSLGGAPAINPYSTYSKDSAYVVHQGGSIFNQNRIRLASYSAGLESTAVTNAIMSSGNVATGSQFVISNGVLYGLNRQTTKTIEKVSIASMSQFTSTSGVFGVTMSSIASSAGVLSSTAHTFDIADGFLYILNTNSTITVIDTAGALQATLSPSFSPALTFDTNGFSSPHIFADESKIYVASDVAVYSMSIDGGNLKYYGSPSSLSGVNPYGYGGRAVRGGIFYQYEPYSSIRITHGFRAYALESLTAGSVTLSSIVDDLGDRSGLAVSEYDTAELSDTVNGYIVTSPMPARSAIEPLQKAYFFDSAEIDNVLTYIKRGGSVVASIPQLDLGADVEELYTHTRRQDSELPSQVLIDYSDTSRSYELGSQQAQRINSPVENVNKLSLPIVMSADYAKEIAHVLLYDAHVERDKFMLSVTNEYIDLNPTDIIQFTIGSKTRRARVVGISYGKNIELDCVAEDATIYTATSTAGASENDVQSVNFRGPTNLYLLDIPLLRNEDDDTGMYIAGSGYFSGWTGATVFKSLDSGITFSPAGNILNASVMGSATTVLATASSTVFDRTNTVTVSIASGTLSSSTESLVIQGANYAVLGSELIQFVTATDNGDGTYTLSTLLRGRRGTDWATGSHATGENFVLLDALNAARIGATVNTERYYKAATFGTPLVIADSKVKTNTGINQKPFSPKYITASRDGSLNLDIVWTRRSRYISSPLWNPPIFEDSESYVIEILDGVGGSVVNSYTSSSELYEYTAAQQTTDFGSTQSTVYVKIYQVSATLGNGYGTEATL